MEKIPIEINKDPRISLGYPHRPDDMPEQAHNVFKLSQMSNKDHLDFGVHPKLSKYIILEDGTILYPVVKTKNSFMYRGKQYGICNQKIKAGTFRANLSFDVGRVNLASVYRLVYQTFIDSTLDKNYPIIFKDGNSLNHHRDNLDLPEIKQIDPKLEYRLLDKFPDYVFFENGFILQRGFGSSDLYNFNGELYRSASIAVNQGGYKQASLRTKNNKWIWKPTHYFTAAAFLGEPDSYDVVRHLDGYKRNNHYTNLAFGSYKDNAEDTIRNNSVTHPNERLLLPEEWQLFKHAKLSGLSDSELMQKFQLCRYDFRQILKYPSQTLA
jgi:hypothetical protein